MRVRLAGVATMWRRLVVSWLLIATPIVQAMDAPRRAVPTDPSIIAIVDVETTGLDPAHHEMVDLGAIYIRPDGRELGRFFVRIHPPHPERLDPGAAAVTGYSSER